MSTLTEMGTKVNHSKSEAALAVKGRDAEAVRKRFVVRRAGIDCLRIGRVDNCIYIPLKLRSNTWASCCRVGAMSFGLHSIDASWPRRRRRSSAYIECPLEGGQT